MNIREFKKKYAPERHPLKPTFKKLGIRYSELSNYLGCSSAMVAHYLNCFVRVPDDIERKLQRLVQELVGGK
ncbi:MAG: hypothetical protein KJN62_01390 [Deltaproteobacteria bacterium]|nr:hypothetical protein [Deltaproteobacteria bacterium]